MAFRSAELKRLYESIHAEGYPISATDASHLFSVGQLQALLNEAIDLNVERRQVEQALAAAVADTQRLAAALSQLDATITSKRRDREDALRDYNTATSEIERLTVLASELPELEDEAASLRLEIARAETLISRGVLGPEAEDALRDQIEADERHLNWIEWQIQDIESEVQWLFVYEMDADIALNRYSALSSELLSLEAQRSATAADLAAAQQRETTLAAELARLQADFEAQLDRFIR